jgi:hypothetical protein
MKAIMTVDEAKLLLEQIESDDPEVSKKAVIEGVTQIVIGFVSDTRRIADALERIVKLVEEGRAT